MKDFSELWDHKVGTPYHVTWKTSDKHHDRKLFIVEDEQRKNEVLWFEFSIKGDAYEFFSYGADESAKFEIIRFITFLSHEAGLKIIYSCEMGYCIEEGTRALDAWKKEHLNQR